MDNSSTQQAGKRARKKRNEDDPKLCEGKCTHPAKSQKSAGRKGQHHNSGNATKRGVQLSHREESLRTTLSEDEEVSRQWREVEGSNFYERGER